MATPVELSTVAADFCRAWNRHDAKGLADLFTGDASFVNVAGTWWRGREEIEAAHAAAHATIFRESRLEGKVRLVTRLGPGVAAVHFGWTLTGLTLPDGTRGPDRQGILLLVLVESGDGWLVRVAQNTDIATGGTAPSPPG